MLMEKELKYLKGAVDSPVRPMACIVGGAKVSSKVSVAGFLVFPQTTFSALLAMYAFGFECMATNNLFSK